MKNLITLLVLLAFSTLFAQEKVLLKTYTFEEVEKLQYTRPRPWVVFIYTNWCGYCYIMKRNTFTDLKVIKALNRLFYFIELNAEEKDNFFFLGRTFTSFGANTGIHELAEALGSIEGTLSYPTTVILNTKNEIVFQYGGFISSDTISKVLKSVQMELQL